MEGQHCSDAEKLQHKMCEVGIVHICRVCVLSSDFSFHIRGLLLPVHGCHSSETSLSHLAPYQHSQGPSELRRSL